MNKNYLYNSSLAPYIEGLINQKRADGYLYEYEGYILKSFDDFCLENGFCDSVITRELVMRWSVQRETEGVNYRNQRVSFIRQLSLYMNSLGIISYIPMQTPSSVTTVPHGNKEITVNRKRKFCNEFLNYLTETRCKELCDINTDNICKAYSQ